MSSGKQPAVENSDAFRKASSLLGISCDALAKFLVQPTPASPRDNPRLSPEERRNGLMIALYDSIVAWIFCLINRLVLENSRPDIILQILILFLSLHFVPSIFSRSMSPPKSTKDVEYRLVHVIDGAGADFGPSGNNDSLSGNYASEKFYQTFLEHIFRHPQVRFSFRLRICLFEESVIDFDSNIPEGSPKGRCGSRSPALRRQLDHSTGPWRDRAVAEYSRSPSGILRESEGNRYRCCWCDSRFQNLLEDSEVFKAVLHFSRTSPINI